MSVQKFVKKAVTVSAIQWTGFNVDEIRRFVTNNRAFFQAKPYEKMPDRYDLTIYTKENVEVSASIGDYIVRDVHGDFYSQKPDVFLQFHDRIE